MARRGLIARRGRRGRGFPRSGRYAPSAGKAPMEGIEPERLPPIAHHALPGRTAAQPDSLFTLKVDSSIYS